MMFSTRFLAAGLTLALFAPCASPSHAESSTKSSGKAPAIRSYITNIPTGKKLIALTYDDGPDPRITPRLIDLLKRKGVTASFYVLGQRVAEYPEITRKLHENGFEVVNHTYDHKLLTKLSEEKIRWELDQTNELITAITGRPVTHMRPPFGGRNSKVDRIIKDRGMEIVLWDIDTQDWRKRTAAQMIANIERNATDGSIVLFHDRYQAVLDATEAVIDSLRARGFTFVTVGQMLEEQRRLRSAGSDRDSVTTKPAHAASQK